ncbi:tyrosine-protein kinase transmembrane receptor Ror-like [Tachypleus tridentatus]|uniref:tyrosine-protein kinase transmembrane receptor Ror-like n=1 Tax=Tachypleus tridentatus TaxID=6853 RepID=UPI003FCFC10E
MTSTEQESVNMGPYDRDECAESPFLCGMEAGCLNTVGSYVCLCNDLKLKDPVRGCSREPGTSNTNLQTTDSINDTFNFDQLLDILRKKNQGTHNVTEMHSKSPGNMSTNYFHSYTIVDPQSSVLYGCLFTVVVVLIASILVCVWWRRRIYYCCRRKLPHAISASSLGNLTQHYLTNPNYYSNSPDNPFLKMLQDMEIPGESITLQETIGEGCFGKVYEGSYVQDSEVSVPVAVKVLKDNLSSEVERDFEREVEAMSTFDHENILKLLGVVLKEAEAVPWMVFEFMQHGNLGELLRNNCSYVNQPPVSLKQTDLVLFATQIARGMTYLSSQHFVHRDLATRNCLVGENLTVKISDFGMSRDIYTCDYYKIGGSRMLPVRWMAPESMMYGKFTLDSDVWSYGVVLWEIFTLGKQPYYGHSNEEVVKLVLQGILLSPPGECPYFIYDIMAGCWKTEPRDRLKFPDIYQVLEFNIPFGSSETLPRSAASWNVGSHQSLKSFSYCSFADSTEHSLRFSVSSIMSSIDIVQDTVINSVQDVGQPTVLREVDSTEDSADT